jgi:hypothetical protein
VRKNTKIINYVIHSKCGKQIDNKVFILDVFTEFMYGDKRKGTRSEKRKNSEIENA